MPAPYETLRLMLQDKGLNADECGVLRVGQIPKRAFTVIPMDLKAIGFNQKDLDMIVVHYNAPLPPTGTPDPPVVPPKPKPPKEPEKPARKPTPQEEHEERERERQRARKPAPVRTMSCPS